MPAIPLSKRLLLPLAALGGLCLLGGADRAQGAAQAATGAGDPAQDVNGLTEPFLDVTLSSPVSGIIRVEQYKEGDAVNKGDLILELDKKLEQIEADRRKDVMDHQKDDMESTQVLFKTSKAISRDEMQKRETEYKVSVADFETAQEQLNRRQIKAPFAGSITEVFLHSGAACEPYQPLVRLVDVGRCYFVGYVTGATASRLNLEQEVGVEVDGYKEPVKAKICFISPVVDPASGLARVKALFDNPSGKIRPGVAAKMHLESVPSRTE
jgi:RND family efflux transporter MFP subunit